VKPCETQVKPWISLTLEILDKLIALDKLNKQKVKMLDGKKQDEQKDKFC